jgi:hypothetical protein
MSGSGKVSRIFPLLWLCIDTLVIKPRRNERPWCLSSTSKHTSQASQDLLVGEWLRKFITLEDNPRAVRLIGDGSLYSPDTIGMYAGYFH